MGVDPADAFAEKPPGLDRLQHQMIGCLRNSRQVAEKTQDFGPLCQVAAGELPYNHWMYRHFAFL